ncbi:hypothetical protein KHS38_10180 [Mucilaginibacter sp. Bleaf8]|uniref:hypothetical protein n=1 Tax=Mucilaginibacter sp. Bleaf8 TaxID=2834430 RepID=UPI001BD1889C|nr:hypothetical protein [Mucilaginibacter sp. Bleaf8]MBS7564772.1 hypothetical protein [Mucilaginibacter sp. Bleaf8]
MNNHNHSVAELPGLKDFHIISEFEFQKYTLEWAKQVASSEMPWDFFNNNDGNCFLMLAQIYYNGATVQNLLSCVGVKNINARFAIVDQYQPYEITSPTFTIILYAIDSLGKRCSAYHIGKPQYNDTIILPRKKPIQGIGNFISSRLAKEWIGEWKIICDHSPKEPEYLSELFLTNYGYLTGYNYLMSDFMYSLFPPGTRTENYDVVILPAVHKHIIHNVFDQPAWSRTFGLVLAGVELVTKHKTSTVEDDEEVNSFYDLSLPTPPSNN